MKKKIYIGLVTSVFATLLALNYSLLINPTDNQITLSSLLSVAKADGEEGENGFICKEDSCSVQYFHATYYGHYKHCGYGDGYCSVFQCFVGCDAM